MHKNGIFLGLQKCVHVRADMTVQYNYENTSLGKGLEYILSTIRLSYKATTCNRGVALNDPVT